MRPAMRDFLARAADYTLTPLSVMLRLATRAPGLGEPPARPPAAAPVRRRARPDDRRRAPRVLAAFAEYGNLGFAPRELAHLAGVSPAVIKGLEAQGVLVREAAPRDAPYPALDPDAAPRPLSPAQAEAAAASLRAAVRRGGYSTTLLKGVTGSGKTEVYLEAVAEALRPRPPGAGAPARDRAVGRVPRPGRGALRRPPRRVAFRRHPGRPPPRLAGGGRAASARLVVGARSALFLPFRDLGLIVVDEEHDGSYKQEDGALYHARDMAVLRASIEGAAVVLASATPSLETWANAERRQVRPARPARALRRRRAAGDGARSTCASTRPTQGRWISPPLDAAPSASASRPASRRCCSSTAAATRR